MKFFWKIFFTTMFISTACFSFGGYILIHSNFNALLENEVQTAHDYSDIVYYSLANECKSTSVSYGQNDNKEEAVRQTLAKVAQSIDINNMNQSIAFGVTDAEGKEVFSSLNQTFDKDMISSLKEDVTGWTMKRGKDRAYIQVIRPVSFLGGVFYIEILREATFIFDNQKTQYETLLKVMAGMLLIGGLITFAVSKLLMRRVVSLTRATQEISAGNLSKRVDMKGRDEFAALSRNFNKMADNLEDKIYELKDAAEKRELFVGAFSHELKTPLTSVIGYADMLRRKKMSDEQIHTCAEYIFGEGKRMEALSMRLLNLIVLKNQKPKRISTEMAVFFDDIKFMIKPQLVRSGIFIKVNIESAVIKFDPELMKTVFINLIDNARKAMEDGGKLLIYGRRGKDCYLVTIADTGKGMEKEELSKIKDAFYMVDKSRSKKQGGAGLGLAICDEILKLHGYAVTFDSVVGKGTCVTVAMKEAGDE